MYLSGEDQANGTGSGSDYASHNNTYYYPYLLQKLYAYQQSTGTKLIDVLSVHCYSDASSNLNVATRELWDPNYQDPDWYAASGLNGGILEWIPLMKQWVNQYYPGLEIGCTEYNWGDETALDGATTQADVEGIYGLYGFDLATRWTVPASQPTYLAMQIYRNYDGNLSTFGDTSVSAAVANPDNLSAFAALRTSDGAMTVMVINKQTGSTPVTISLANFSSTGTAQAYQVSSATQTSINSLGSVTVSNNAISTTVPSQSITLFVIPSGSVLSAPTTPTGLAATVGNDTVTLTWNAGGGATSYTVSRGSSSAGPFTAIGTVTSPSPTTLTDTNVTNGNTYYYVVSGTNSKGTSPNSAPVAATPMVPPTFTSSATASPNPVTQNASTTITATVKCTANTLSDGTVQIIALDPSGNVALTQNFTSQSFTANQTQTYTAPITPTMAGTYTVEVGVFSATGQQWSLNTSAGTITVNSALSFSGTATASPTSIAVTSSSTITVQVKDTGTVGLTSGIVQMLILDPSGNTIATQNWTGETFTAGGTLTLTYTFTPSSIPEETNGTYTMEIGVFNSTWSTDYYWNSTAGTITLTGGSGQPAFTASGTANPTSITASGSSTVTFSVKDTGGALTNANVEIQVYNSAATAVGTQVYSGQNFTQNGSLPYTYTWTPSSQSPAVTATGTYTVEVGVFNSGWTTDYYWNSNLATITITAGAPAAPTLTAISPASGPAAGGTSVTLTGTNLTGATAVKFGSTAAAGFTVNSTTSITATSPAGSGAVSVTVTTPGGTSNGESFTYTVAAPTLTAISPASGPAAGGTSVTLTGTNLTGATAVKFGSTAATSFTVNSATSITATSPAGSGTVDVTVTTPGGTSNGESFTYTVAAPTLTAISPASGPAAGGTSVTLTGTNLTGATAVKFGSTAATSFTVNSATSITATSPAGSGTVDVTVTTPGGTSNGESFTYTVAAPTLTAISPASGPAAGGTSVTLTGTNLTGATAVKFGSTAATSFTVNSATSITATSPAGSGTVDVTVTTPGGTSNGESFTYTVAAPTLTAISPASGPAAGGTSVTLTGTNLTGATAVKFGSTAATSFTVNSATSITATSPAGSGTVDVTVTTPGGTSNGESFTYTQTVVPSFTISGTAVTVTPGAITANTSTITVKPASGFTGSVALTAAVTSSPTGAQDLPTLSFGSTAPVIISGANRRNGHAHDQHNGGDQPRCERSYPHPRTARGSLVRGWWCNSGLLALFGIPARRRSWRTMLGMLVLLAVLAGGASHAAGYPRRRLAAAIPGLRRAATPLP